MKIFFTMIAFILMITGSLLTSGCAFDRSYFGNQSAKGFKVNFPGIRYGSSKFKSQKRAKPIKSQGTFDLAYRVESVGSSQGYSSFGSQTVHKQPPESTANLSEILSRFEDVDNENYYLRRGDEIFIDVWTNPELSGTHIIGPDGKITLPLSGPLRLTGLTREEAAAKVVEALSPNYPNMTATVRVDKYSLYRISVLGNIVQPGTYAFETRPTLLEALTRAGGLHKVDRLDSGQPFPKPHAQLCAIIRGSEQMALLNLNPLMQGKDLHLNIRLKADDLIQVPEFEATPLYVLGQVKKAGFYNVAPDMTLLDALAQAGGLTRDASKRNIHLIRPSSYMNTKINLKELMTPDSSLDAELLAGDIIYVPPNWLAEIGYFLRNISPANPYFFLLAD